MDKRKFIKSASAATVLAAFGLSLDSCSSDDEPTPSGGSSKFEFDLSSGSYSALKTEGQWLLVSSETLLLVNVGGSISAFSSVCTHSGCSDNWSLGSNATCTCHNSVFDNTGSPLSGPASRSLTRKSVTVEGDIVTIG